MAAWPIVAWLLGFCLLMAYCAVPFVGHDDDDDDGDGGVKHSKKERAEVDPEEVVAEGAEQEGV